MNSARIERMTRELNAEPAAQFFESLIGLIARLSQKGDTPAKVAIPAKGRLSLE
jgi:hypothetical protein